MHGKRTPNKTVRYKTDVKSQHENAIPYSRAKSKRERYDD